MRCPFCGHEDTQVKDSRPTDDNSAIRRRRYCPSCGSRFTTFERVQLRELTVVKKNGQRVAFDRDKLQRSISVAVRKRPVDPERVGVIRTYCEPRETASHLDVTTLAFDRATGRLDLADLAGFVGAEKTAPGKVATPQTTRVLPDTPYNLEKLKSADADVRFEGKRVIGAPAAVLSRGELIVSDDKWVASKKQGRGQFVRRGTFSL